MKPYCSKIALTSTLINTGWGLSVVSLWTGLSVTQTSQAIWLYTLRYHTICFHNFFLAVIFSAYCAYPNSLCIICCLHSESAIISEIVVTPINSQIYGRRTALTSIQLATKSGAQFSNESRVQKCRTWRMWCSVWLMRGMEWKRVLFKLSFSISAGVSIQPQEDIVNIHYYKN